MKHTAKRTAKGNYAYRGYWIKRFNQRWLHDPALSAVYWSVYASPNEVAIDIANTLAEAKVLIDNILAR